MSWSESSRARLKHRAAVLRLAFAFGAVASCADAQPSTPAPSTSPGSLARPRMTARWVSTPPVIDGRLDDRSWQAAVPVDGFVQRAPHGGAPATQRSEVRIVYDDAAVYVGVRNFDSAPDSIAQQLGRRDAEDIYSDWFFVGFDSYGDRRTAFAFGVSPRGVLRDSYLYNDDDDDAQWDAVWNVAARTDSAGWTAEFRIPLSQLRYDVSGERGAVRPWGINFSREIARTGEESFWAPTPADAPGIVSRFGDLVGLDSLRSASRVEIVPYIRTQVETQPPGARNRFVPAQQLAVAAGGDIRLKLPQSLTLTATVNPDFGQVEADPAVVNLSAFEIFFPERRPFFLENADGFAFGRTRTFNDNDTPTFFYTRRIGRPPQRRPSGANVTAVGLAAQTPILGALKLSGTTPSGWQIGSLNALTSRETAEVLDTLGAVRDAAAEPLTNYHVSRVRKLLRGGNAGIGAFVSDVRRGLADSALAAQLTSSATIVGLDWESAWQRRTWTVGGVLASSGVRGRASAIDRLQRANYRSLQRPDASHLTYDPARTALGGHYGALTLAKSAGERVLGSVTYEETSAGFEANDAGFQFRSDFRTVSSSLTYRNPLQSRLARAYELGVFSTISDNFGGDRIEERYAWMVGAEFLNFWTANLFGSFSPATLNDRLLRGGPLATRPAATVSRVSIESDPRKPVIGAAAYEHTSDASGARSDGAELALDWRPVPQARVRLGPSFQIQRTTGQYVQSVADATAPSDFARVRYAFADVTQREARFDTRLDWTFSPWLSLQLFLQPFASSGRFTRFKEFTTAGRFDFAEYGVDRGTVTPLGGGAIRVDPDGAGPAAPFTIGNQDFSVRALRGNAVLRWEYRPGSSLFFVWTQQREQQFDDVRTDVGAQALRTFSDPGRHVFLVKFSRWIGR
ncbi:MAG: carbohydrate binding family 9 domain-containing protein [Gemmatimonadaceae bacterium]|nr:carbohydrate binding family 9 domain-containing protein [Gemmatimonadaceae bacterium]